MKENCDPNLTKREKLIPRPCKEGNQGETQKATTEGMRLPQLRESEQPDSHNEREGHPRAQTNGPTMHCEGIPESDSRKEQQCTSDRDSIYKTLR